MAFVTSIFIMFSVSYSVFCSKPCGVLTNCAVKKCLDHDHITKLLKSSPREAIFGNLVEKFDMVCIAAKCTDECKACKGCFYALEQMTALASGEKTSGQCPKLEGCVENCLSEDINKALQCVADRCNVHCYDGDCPSCNNVSKMMFTKVCKDLDMLSLPQIDFKGKCPDLFHEMAEDYVSKKRKV